MKRKFRERAKANPFLDIARTALVHGVPKLPACNSASQTCVAATHPRLHHPIIPGCNCNREQHQAPAGGALLRHTPATHSYTQVGSATQISRTRESESTFGHRQNGAPWRCAEVPREFRERAKANQFFDIAQTPLAPAVWALSRDNSHHPKKV